MGRVPADHDPTTLPGFKPKHRLHPALGAPLPLSFRAEHGDEPLPRRRPRNRGPTEDVDVCCNPPVVETRVEDDLHGSLAFDALDAPMNLVGCRPRVVGPRHVVRQPNRPVTLDAKHGLQHVRIGVVALQAFEGIVDGADACRPSRVLVEQRPEHRRAVETRKAEPIDRAIGTHERRRKAVTDQSVVCNRERARRLFVGEHEGPIQPLGGAVQVHSPEG